MQERGPPSLSRAWGREEGWVLGSCRVLGVGFVKKRGGKAGDMAKGQIWDLPPLFLTV